MQAGLVEFMLPEFVFGLEQVYFGAGVIEQAFVLRSSSAARRTISSTSQAGSTTAHLRLALSSTR